MADLFTKAFTDRSKFEHLRTLTGIAADLTDVRNCVGLLNASREVESLSAKEINAEEL